MAHSILEVKDLHKSFGGNQVLSGVNFVVEEGELSSIIGPNGAGKTTLFNLITGLHVPTRGAVYFQGKNIAGCQPYEVVRRGIAKAFQITSIFPRLSVLENVTVAIVSQQKRNANLVTPVAKLKEVHAQARLLLESVGLADKADQQSGTLAHGNQKRLDIALALALKPKLLMLDEPTAGMSPEERRATVELVQRLWEQLKISMLFIEHDMDIVFGISQKVRVLCYGTLIAEGPPAEISKNKKVIEVYLGEEL
ncbi:MAG: ABC transporter ATP-binding protein [Desulfobacterales bacterium]|nr:ABC transporter ATP-binding protein [Desulfobacterales bacterium]